MTVTINPEHILISIILLLMVLQIWQWRVTEKLRKECDDLWTQLGTLASSLASQLIGMQKEINKKEDKK